MRARATLVLAVALLPVGALAAEGFETQTPIQLSPAQEARAMRIGKQIRCVVCQGMSAADSPAEMAHAMMTRVRELVVEGKTDDQILDYFAGRYGEWALLEPKPRSNPLVWVLPGVALLAGFGLIAYVVWGRRGPPASPPPPSSLAAKAPEPATGDKYRDEIRAEVDR